MAATVGRQFWNLGDVDDSHLEASLTRLAGAHARLEARIVAHLAEVESRRIHLLAGYSSMFDYCRRRLGLSEYEAYCRIAVARTARKYPVIFGMLDRRELHLTAICEVREFLTESNHLPLLQDIAGKTKMQVREVLAERFPRPDAEQRLRTLPVMEPLSPGRYRLELTLSATQKAKLEEARDLLSHVPGSHDFAVIIERALDALIARVRAKRFGETSTRSRANGATPVVRPAPSAKVPQARPWPAEVGASAADATSATGGPSGKVAPRSDESTSARGGPGVEAGPSAVGGLDARQEIAVAPSSGPSSERGAEMSPHEGSVGLASDHGAGPHQARQRRHLKASVRREVSARDGHRCGFVGADGRRCEERAFLQFHHVKAWANGGEDSVENLTLLCARHNVLVAEREFGLRKIQRALRRKLRVA